MFAAWKGCIASAVHIDIIVTEDADLISSVQPDVVGGIDTLRERNNIALLVAVGIACVCSDCWITCTVLLTIHQHGSIDCPNVLMQVAPQHGPRANAITQLPLPTNSPSPVRHAQFVIALRVRFWTALAWKNVALRIASVVKHHHFDRLQLGEIRSPFDVVLKSITFGNGVTAVVHWTTTEGETTLKTTITTLSAFNCTVWSVPTFNAVFHRSSMAPFGVIEPIPVDLQILCAQKMKIATTPALGANPFESIPVRDFVGHVVELRTSTPEEVTLAFIKG